MIKFKKIAVLAIAFASFGVWGASSQTASADVIANPGSAGSITQVNEGNVLKDYNQNDINMVQNVGPTGNMSRKYVKSNDTSSSDVFSTIDGSSQDNTFSTLFYMPDGFNVSNYQHGNFQSVTMDNDGNLYFVESNGSGTNQGCVAKLDMAKLKQLGGDKSVSTIWKAFDYFNPYTTQGMANNNAFDQVEYGIQDSLNTVSDLTDKINETKSKQDTQETYQNNAQKWYNYWKNKKSKYAKNSKSYKNAVAKMAHWSKSYQGHKAKVAGYNKDISNYQGQMSSAQDQIDAVKAQNPEMFKYADIAQCFTLSPSVNIGHGQTLTFNPANQHLYLEEDDTLSDLKTDQNNVVLEMDPNTLKPIREYNFKMLHSNNGKVSNLQLHTLAFDANGNAYWGRKTGDGYMFFYGRLDQDGVSFSACMDAIGNRGGATNQGIAVNQANNRLYFISDDILTSVPANSIRKSKFSPNDVHYQAFDSLKEFESLTFDRAGYGYLMTLWPAEILKSSDPLN